MRIRDGPAWCQRIRPHVGATITELASPHAKTNRTGLEELKATVETRLTRIQEDNAARLEQMRTTVDEKLQGTLEKRLGESFRRWIRECDPSMNPA